jgi:hypothetical protein
MGSINTAMQCFATFFETYYMNDSEHARTGRGPLLNQPNSISTITRTPRKGFKGNEGYGEPDETIIKWPTLKKKRKAQPKSRASSQENQQH